MDTAVTADMQISLLHTLGRQPQKCTSKSAEAEDAHPGCLNGPGATVTWCNGHLLGAAPPEVYDAALKRWSIEKLPITSQQWRVEVKPKTDTQFKVVKALLPSFLHHTAQPKLANAAICLTFDAEGRLHAIR